MTPELWVTPWPPTLRHGCSATLSSDNPLPLCLAPPPGASLTSAQPPALPPPQPVRVWTHLLLLTGDREYGDTSLPSSGLERLVLREYCRWGTPLSGCCAPKPRRPEPLGGEHTGRQTRSALTGDACSQQTRPGPRGVLPQTCWCPPISPAPQPLAPELWVRGDPSQASDAALGLAHERGGGWLAVSLA